MLELFDRDLVRATYGLVIPPVNYAEARGDSPRFRIILRKLDLVLSYDVCIAVENYEPGRPGKR